ncbi:hypothetical protein TEA_018726 [Camellia sinensis var. sinensis]|uniref:Uncharacterized protein n=1 Tax=Camellia sinensis var. sinensis TaxID=542762 RepID=A0A4S4D7J0_CAMSN|nr:hypothetical protein TEA_018726 [Camellia sinensis var. sinensis]
MYPKRTKGVPMPYPTEPDVPDYFLPYPVCMQPYRYAYPHPVSTRIMGSNDNSNLFCSCGVSENQPFEDPLPGLKIFPGLKRKISEDFQRDELESSDKFVGSKLLLNSKRRHTLVTDKPVNWVENLLGNASDDSMDIVKHNGMLGCSKSPCAVEGCLSKGFAGLFSEMVFADARCLKVKEADDLMTGINN